MDWTPEAIARFWDHMAGQEVYFSKILGSALLEVLQTLGPLHERRLFDYGCGRGDLSAHVLRAGAWVAGGDISPGSAAAANERFVEETRWLGARVMEDGLISWPQDEFDRATCIETVEHIPIGPRETMLSELLRVLKPAGLLLVTTPNEENMALSTVCCPACGAEFHTVQHIHRYTAASLSQLLVEQGFEILFCRGVLLDALRYPPYKPWYLRPRYLLRRLRWHVAGLLDRLAPMPVGQARALSWGLAPGANLVAIARKPAGSRVTA